VINNLAEVFTASVENTGYRFVPETTVSARIRILKRFSCSKNWIVDVNTLAKMTVKDTLSRKRTNYY
jgi:hypothetical protein